jgi:hypothetical protein
MSAMIDCASSARTETTARRMAAIASDDEVCAFLILMFTSIRSTPFANDLRSIPAWERRAPTSRRNSDIPSWQVPHFDREVAGGIEVVRVVWRAMGVRCL